MSLDTLISHNLGQTAEPVHDGGCALVLMGGGARTAYQAGVLKALAGMRRPASQAFPFRWLFGTSAGALNASYLASIATQGMGALSQLATFWSGLRSERVYRLEAPGWVRANRVVAGLTLARQVTGRFKTISFWDSFHGAGFGSAGVGGEAEQLHCAMLLTRQPRIGRLARVVRRVHQHRQRRASGTRGLGGQRWADDQRSGSDEGTPLHLPSASCSMRRKVP